MLQVTYRAITGYPGNKTVLHLQRSRTPHTPISINSNNSSSRPKNRARLHKQNMMLMRASLRLRRHAIVRAGIDPNLRPDNHRNSSQVIQKFRPISRQRRQRRKRPLLQPTMRIQSIDNNPLMPVQNPSPEILPPPRLPLQFQKLMQNFLRNGIKRPRQSPIQMPQWLAIRRQQPPQSLLIRRKTPRQRPRKRFHFHAPPQMLPSAHHIAKIQLIFFQQTRNRRLHHSKTSPRQNRRHSP